MLQPFRDWFHCDWLAITETIATALCPYLELGYDQSYHSAIGFATSQWFISNLSATVNRRHRYRFAICWDWSVTSRRCSLTGQWPLVDQSLIITKCIWARPRENVSYVICKQQRCKSACASAQADAQADQRLCCSTICIDSIAEISKL